MIDLRTLQIVLGGDVGALYAAVYDENGQPRDNAEIFQEPGIFRLNPEKPFGGRLILGAKSILRSALDIAVDEDGVPLLHEGDASPSCRLGALGSTGAGSIPIVWV